jgi:peptide/nickel transport system permease protein
VVIMVGPVGLLVGTVAGYVGGWLDVVLMRVTDVFLAFPGILLAIALVAVLGPGLGHVVVALVAFGWVDYARLARGQVLQVREADYVAAARSAGARAPAIVWRHVLPNVLPPLLVQASLGMAGAILAESALSFLGLGLAPPTPSWGGMIDAGRGHLVDAPHLALFPGIALFAVVLALNLLADGLGDRLGAPAGGRG